MYCKRINLSPTITIHQFHLLIFPFALQYRDQGICQVRIEAFLAEESLLLGID